MARRPRLTASASQNDDQGRGGHSGWRAAQAWPSVGVPAAGRRRAETFSRLPGQITDFGGPEVRTVKDLAHSYLSTAGKRRAIVPIWLPGKVFHAYRRGENLTSEHAAGTITFEQYLTEQFAAGRLPYSDAIRDYLRRTPKEMR